MLPLLYTVLGAGVTHRCSAGRWNKTRQRVIHHTGVSRKSVCYRHIEKLLISGLASFSLEVFYHNISTHQPKLIPATHAYFFSPRLFRGPRVRLRYSPMICSSSHHRTARFVSGTDVCCILKKLRERTHFAQVRY